MEKKLIDMTLPPFAFVEGGHDGQDLYGRNVIIHVRTASIIEMVLRADLVMTMHDEVLQYNFSFIDQYGATERWVALLHYCATLDEQLDRQLILEKVMKPAAAWFIDYCKWEDKHNGKLGRST